MLISYHLKPSNYQTNYHKQKETKYSLNKVSLEESLPVNVKTYHCAWMWKGWQGEGTIHDPKISLKSVHVYVTVCLYTGSNN